jgi:hypothetical protein
MSGGGFKSIREGDSYAKKEHYNFLHHVVTNPFSTKLVYGTTEQSTF